MQGALVILLYASAPRVAFAIRRYPYFPSDGQEKGLDRQPLQVQRPFNIAHRGSNGEIPEETAEAYLVSISLLLIFFLILLKFCLEDFMM
jgi:hypothetical protein